MSFFFCNFAAQINIYMSETLHIEHFGPIPKADVEIRRVTIFIGSQGSGKSTIAKLLTIFRDHFWRCAVLQGDTKEVMGQFAEFAIDKYFTNKTYIKYTNDSVFNDVIEYKSGKFTYTSDDMKSKELLTVELGLIDAVSSSFVERLGYKKVEDLLGKPEMKMLHANNRTSLYVPAERVMAGQLSTSIFNIITNNIPLSNPIMEYLSFFEKARKEFSMYSIPFLDAEYIIEKGEEKVIVGKKQGKKNTLSLKDCSSGLQTVIPLLMIMEYCSKMKCFDSFVLEEPELNLFPSNQQELLRFIMSRYNNITNNKTAIVITTHSPYILSILNNYLYAAKVADMLGNEKSKVNEIVDERLHLQEIDCAVYSLGKIVNQKDYCVSVISKETGLIDYNFLDAVSMEIGDVFDNLQLLSMQAERASIK